VTCLFRHSLHLQRSGGRWHGNGEITPALRTGGPLREVKGCQGRRGLWGRLTGTAAGFGGEAAAARRRAGCASKSSSRASNTESAPPGPRSCWSRRDGGLWRIGVKSPCSQHQPKGHGAGRCSCDSVGSGTTVGQQDLFAGAAEACSLV